MIGGSIGEETKKEVVGGKKRFTDSFEGMVEDVEKIKEGKTVIIENNRYYV